MTEIPSPSPEPAFPTTSKLAIFSLITGVLSFFCSFFTGIPAVILGAMSLNQISKSNGALAGRGIALAGILSGVICGIIGTALLAGLAAPLVLRQRHKAEEVEVRVQLAEFHRQVTAYRIDNGTLPDPANAGRMLEIPESRLNGEVIYFPEVDFEKPDQTLLVVPLRHATLILDSNGVTVTADDVDTAEGVPIFPQ